MQRIRCLLLALIFVGVGACSPVEVLNATVPTSALKISRDISFGDSARLKLDVYQRHDQSAVRPVAVFFYGGSWKEGSRTDYLFAAEQLSELGFVVVVPDYRVYPNVRFPAFVEDAALAVKWAVENIRNYGGDPENLFLIGHSAGAHIAAMVALDETYLAQAGTNAANIKGVVGLAGPYSFIPSKTASIAPVFAHLPDENVARPIMFVDGGEPPLLLLHGADDDTVYLYNTDQLTEKVRQTGGRVEKVIYPDIGHVGILLAMSRPFGHYAPVLQDIEAFVRRYAKPSISLTSVEKPG